MTTCTFGMDITLVLVLIDRDRDTMTVARCLVSLECLKACRNYYLLLSII
jgi:hypothetical protein